MTLPCVVFTTVVRGARKGDEHGAIWVADLELGEARRVVDWHDPALDFSGRGGDRGLRGIRVVGDGIFVAASRAIVLFTPEWERVATWTCPTLERAHSIAWHEGLLWVTSTSYDALLVLDPTRGFVYGIRLGEEPEEFDPNRPREKSSSLHVNSVAAFDGAIYAAGLHSPALFRIRRGDLEVVDELPLGTHDVTPTARGLCYSDTSRDEVVLGDRRVAVPPVDPTTLEGYAGGPLARPRFARGLAVCGDVVVGGSSPARVTAYDLPRGIELRTMGVTRDVRHAVHGVTEWPYD